jgi:hypothetical protein
MAWRRHNRNITKEVFYDGTTIDGTRLEKGMGEIADGINDVKKGNTKQRFVATQYHAGFNPIDRTSGHKYHFFPFLRHNNTVGGTVGAVPVNAPFNPLRFKSSAVPGIDPDAGNADQYFWTRSFHFERPVVVHGVSVLIHLDVGSDADRPYPGTRDPAVVPRPYEYNTVGLPGAGDPPQGFTPTSNTIDVPIVLDVMNPAAPEDARLTDVEFVRARFVINEEKTSIVVPDPSGTGWDDFAPNYNSGDITDAQPLYGRIVEYRDLNIPVHERSRVRLAIAVPFYDGALYTQGTWGDIPWFIQAWSVTLTVLEEVQTIR